jgi:osomolarity two-component system sensor histidine kinase SLN1
MRVSIREQLACLILASSLLGLAVVSVSVWLTNHAFVLNVASTRLRNAASLKAAQVAGNLELMETVAEFITTRASIQDSLARYGNGTNLTSANFVAAQNDIQASLGEINSNGRALALQAQVFAQDINNRTASVSVLRATGQTSRPIELPWTSDNGTTAYLGDVSAGYPRELYPNLTIVEDRVGGVVLTSAAYRGQRLLLNSTLVLGPLTVNATFSLISLTLPILNTTTRADGLGWLTVVMDATLIRAVIGAPEGLGATGQTLLFGPVGPSNLFSAGVLYDGQDASPQVPEVRYLFPLASSMADRHPQHVAGTPNAPFSAADYPAVEQALTERNDPIDNTGTNLATYNEANKPVSVGFSLAPSTMVDWVIVVEQAQSEVYAPINDLRNILLACVLSVVGFLAVVSFPLAHWAILPIRRLRIATAETIESPKQDHLAYTSGSEKTCYSFSVCKGENPDNSTMKWRQPRFDDPELQRRMTEDKPFRIPNKVRIGKRVLRDELSELTATFNEMSDELFVQYARLEERVRQRTLELEQSKKAAEAANETKTLFIANISHELKTPLNGILGMCAVCMQEDDPSKIKESLGIIYKSGDLLLKLLTDLLTFSRNQVEQVATLEEKEFRLRDVEEQIHALFAKQAAEKRIDLQITFEDMSFGDETGSMQLGMYQTQSRASDLDIRNLLLWGDPHRILQVIINLVSNSLKFTPAGGSISLKIRCTAGAAMPVGLSHSASAASMRLRRSSTFDRRHSLHYEDTLQQGTANLIKPHTAIARARNEGSRLLPLGQDLYFEFGVQDTGPGIPVDMQQRIFEPFVQGEIGLSRQHGGAGLGLSICSQLASLMGGSMSLSSVPGEGSLFSFHLPLRHVRESECHSIATTEPIHGLTEDCNVFSSSQHITYDLDDNRAFSAVKELPPRRPALVHRISEAASTDPGLQTPGSEMTASSMQESMCQSTPSTDTSPRALEDSKMSSATSTGTIASSHPIRVLIAEDNKVNQEVVLRMLKLEKILDVTIANDGQEALELVQASITAPSSSSSSLSSSSSTSSSYDIIFMDIQMPRLDGLQAARAVRSAGFRNPIIALTAFAEESNVRECYAAGMDFFLAKPIKRAGLRDVVRKFCGVAPATSASVSTVPPTPEVGVDGASNGSSGEKSLPSPDESPKEGSSNPTSPKTT